MHFKHIIKFVVTFYHTPSYCEVQKPQSFFRKYSNCESGRALEKISAGCCFVSIGRIVIIFCDTNDRKWWYLSAMYFVLRFIWGAFANAKQLWLSSKTLQLNSGVFSIVLKWVFNSLSRFISGITSRNDCNSEMYSLSVVDNEI